MDALGHTRLVESTLYRHRRRAIARGLTRPDVVWHCQSPHRILDAIRIEALRAETPRGSVHESLVGFSRIAQNTFDIRFTTSMIPAANRRLLIDYYSLDDVRCCGEELLP